MDRERKTKALNLRVTERQRASYERAAALEGESLTTMVLSAADERAEAILQAHISTAVPSDVFDELLARLDEPAAPLAPSLERALAEPRIVHR